MLNRPAVFVRVEDEDGHVGWGEVWANFPSTGAEHRARLVNEVLAPLISRICGQASPSDVFEKLTQATSVLALQSGEPGPFAQAIAGIDLAVWDLYARRRNTALWKLLGGSRGTDQGLCQRHQSDRFAADGGSGAGTRASRAETEDRLRSRGRPRQSRVASRPRRQRHAGRRCQPGLVDRAGAGGRARIWRIRSRLAGGADPCRSAMAGMATPCARARRAARGGRKYREPCRVRAGARRRRVARRSARYRQMGRAERLLRHRARHLEIRQDVLSALSRRRDRSAGIGAFAGRGRGRRSAGGRFQRQSAARSVLRSRRRCPRRHGDA